MPTSVSAPHAFEAPSAHSLTRRLVKAWPWLVGLLSFALYFSTLCPTVHWSDSAEFVAAGAMLGIPHPPGSPLYVMMAWLFSRLPFDPAYSINLLSALCAAASVGLLCAVARRLGASLFASTTAALLLGQAPLLWAHANIAEVYGPATLVQLSVLWLLVVGFERRSAGHAVAAAFLAGLGLGIHYGLATCGLGYICLVVAIGTGGRWPNKSQVKPLLRLAAVCCLAAACGATVLLYVPLRAQAAPVVNSMDVLNWEGAWWSLKGGEYHKWFYSPTGFFPQLGWVFRVELTQLLYGFAVAAWVGLRALFDARRGPVALTLILIVVGNTWYFFDYAAFQLGGEYYGEKGMLPTRLYREVDVFFLPTVYAICLAVAPGLDATARWLKAKREWWPRAITVVCCVALGARITYMLPHMDRSDDWSAHEFGQKVLEQLPDNSVILHFTTSPEWKPATVLELYFQKVHGARPDITVLKRATPEHVDWLLQQGYPVYVFTDVGEFTERWELRQEGRMYRLDAPDVPRP